MLHLNPAAPASPVEHERLRPIARRSVGPAAQGSVVKRALIPFGQITGGVGRRGRLYEVWSLFHR
jgi:hypothetical protein